MKIDPSAPALHLLRFTTPYCSNAQSLRGVDRLTTGRISRGSILSGSPPSCTAVSLGAFVLRDVLENFQGTIEVFFNRLAIGSIALCSASCQQAAAPIRHISAFGSPRGWSRLSRCGFAIRGEPPYACQGCPFGDH